LIVLYKVVGSPHGESLPRPDRGARPRASLDDEALSKQRPSLEPRATLMQVHRHCCPLGVFHRRMELGGLPCAWFEARRPMVGELGPGQCAARTSS
jgi:hypothetical protein